jgi:hypothetical protein
VPVQVPQARLAQQSLLARQPVSVAISPLVLVRGLLQSQEWQVLLLARQ